MTRPESHADGLSDRFSSKYSSNQCTLVIRVDNEAIEVPLNFGMTADDIKRLYPYLLQFASMPVENPSVKFSADTRKGVYNDLSDDDFKALCERARIQSSYWYGKSEASILDIAIRFAVDIRLKGIAELSDIFAPDSTLEKAKQKPVEPISDEEAEQIIHDMKLETEVDRDYDPGDEQDVPLGIAGGLDINFYQSTDDDDFMSDELDSMESKLDVNDDFSDMLARDDDLSSYKSNYDPNRPLGSDDVKDGLLNMYGDSPETSSIFDDMDRDDGINTDGPADTAYPMSNEEAKRIADGDYDDPDYDEDSYDDDDDDGTGLDFDSEDTDDFNGDGE
jgi:hypothetical protein